MQERISPGWTQSRITVPNASGLEGEEQEECSYCSRRDEKSYSQSCSVWLTINPKLQEEQSDNQAQVEKTGLIWGSSFPEWYLLIQERSKGQASDLMGGSLYLKVQVRIFEDDFGVVILLSRFENPECILVFNSLNWQVEGEKLLWGDLKDIQDPNATMVRLQARALITSTVLLALAMVLTGTSKWAKGTGNLLVWPIVTILENGAKALRLYSHGREIYWRR